MFRYLITLEPLGFLYGSAGRFLSPENLVGRAGMSFPPQAPTVSGLFAARYGADAMRADKGWQFAGPFWSYVDNPQDFYVPTPMHCLVKEGQVRHLLRWNGQGWQPETEEKFDKRGWIPISAWRQLKPGQAVTADPWTFCPHLHPRLQPEQRRVWVDETRQRGSLFLENAVALQPGVCLAYLSSHPLDAGWYRFGGEGHLVQVQCQELDKSIQELLNQPVGQTFATITAGVWGSNRLSYRWPVNQEGKPLWPVTALLTERPHPYRYRLGGTGTGRRLSRGRYAVPAGSVYVLGEALPPWQAWPDEWFPQEGYSFKRWGCGLALPLSVDQPQFAVS
ncbi:MAG: type III-B CRISPR module-associated Cmr3 family protein [Gloeomargarita sp. SKYBB_i_bin120]|nr:type III-B CRISPR module-associated protein Cmr3 [Gloeomargarita sp. SKYB120]MDW8179264.1 type III-B CRISPR module-associated Cmr3 family protein [Gloeomargarita sp. SKYBB_i_bin120]